MVREPEYMINCPYMLITVWTRVCGAVGAIGKRNLSSFARKNVIPSAE